MPADQELSIPTDLNGQTLASAIKRLGDSLSWSEVKRLILARHIRINGTICLDEARRVTAGDVVQVAAKPGAPVPRDPSAVPIVHRDEHLVIVDKPAGIQTIRRPEERDFSEEKKRLQPTLDEVVAFMLRQRGVSAGPKLRGPARLPRVRAVHRLDRDTSGLMLFARSPEAESALVKMFSAHDVQRTYTAIVHGSIAKSRTIETWLVRDRGDGLRGSLLTGVTASSGEEPAQRAVTRIRPVERIGVRYTVVECKLETGRTHQIRIHLSEMGHRLCGEQVYIRPKVRGESLKDESGAPRQALHSSALRLKHPITGADLQFNSPFPRDLAKWLASLGR